MSEALDHALEVLERVFPDSACEPIGPLPDGHEWRQVPIPNKNGALEWVPMPVATSLVMADREPVYRIVEPGKSNGELAALEHAGIFVSQSFDGEGHPIIEVINSYETEPSIQ